MTTLDSLGFATRKQLQATNDLKGTRNANRILSRMEKEGAIKSVYLEKKVYYVSHKGKERIDSNKAVREGLMFHTLMRNDLYIRLGMPKDWRVEVPVEFEYKSEPYHIIPDAMYKKKGEYQFIEVDNVQTMRTNKDKIEIYAKLFKLIWQQENHRPTLIWYTLSQTRKGKIEEECKRKGVKYLVYSGL